jgi:arylsulfatase A-like enzyme
MSPLPHILYVLSDEHSGFAMSHAGDPNVRTPVMDRLASEGVSFRRAYANSPICTPSRGTIFSGRHAHAGPVQNFFDVYKPSAPSTATLLREAGYRTAYFGKWHMGVVRDQMSPAVRADQAAYPEINYFRRTPEYHRGGFEDWYAFELNDAPFNFSYYEGHEINPRQRPGYQTEALTDMAIEYLENYGREQPLFLVLSVEPPHFPLEAPATDLRLDPAHLITRPNFAESAETPRLRESLATYYAMIENLDRNLGRLVEAMGLLPRFRNHSLLVYFSDHGEYMGSHGYFERKEHPHEEAVRIPAIFWQPGIIPAQGPRDELFSLVDMLPTTLGLAGLPVPPHVQGMDFTPACLRESFAGPEDVLIEMSCNPRWDLDFLDWRGIVTPGWKYVFYETGHEFLFDLKADPYEQRNLAASDPVHRERLRRLLLQRLAETREPYFDVLMEYGVTPEGPVISVGPRQQSRLAPTWGNLTFASEDESPPRSGDSPSPSP